jgi:hypothetical protein
MACSSVDVAAVNCRLVCAFTFMAGANPSALTMIVFRMIFMVLAFIFGR